MVHSLKNYDMRVVHRDGSRINWNNPPKANAMVSWTKTTIYGRHPIGSFRTICHMDRLNRLTYRKWGTGLKIYQPDWNTTVSASAGTHDFDACWDIYIPGVDWWVAQRFFRRNGFGCWYRRPPSFSPSHIHGFTLPPREGSTVGDDFRTHGFKVGIYVDGGYSTRGRLVTSSQLVDYYNHALGLSGQHSRGGDRSWFPNHIPDTIFNLHGYVKARRQEQNAR